MGKVKNHLPKNPDILIIVIKCTLLLLKFFKFRMSDELNACMYEKIPKILEPSLIEYKSAIVSCEYNDKSDLTMMHLFI